MTDTGIGTRPPAAERGSEKPAGERTAGAGSNGADPGGVDALYQTFLARAAALHKGSVGPVDIVLDEIANQPIPPWLFKSLAAAIGEVTGFDKEHLTRNLHQRRKALEKIGEEEGGEGAEASTDPVAAYEQCREIAEDPELLRRLLDIASRLGIAGDRRGVVSTYLVAVSRLLDDPSRMLRKGSPASGKNHVIDNLLPLFNKHIDYVVFTSASAKALFYSPIDFRHMLLIIPEAAALAPTRAGNNEEFAMILRELISSGRLAYHTVQPTGPNGSLVGVEKEKEGPVALMMTTARDNVEEEMATRVLLTVTDESDGQTKRILATVADKAAGNGLPPVTDEELARWRAFQDWLRLGPRNVVIPFAPEIAALTDRRAMRIRRDFSAVISLTKTSALMHRAQRESDAKRCIIAEPDDYKLALVSLGEGLEELAHGGDTSAIGAVRAAVCTALAECRLTWRRTRALDEFRKALQKYLTTHGHAAAAEQLGPAGTYGPPPPVPPGVERAADYIHIVTATDPAINISSQDMRSMFRAVADALKQLRQQAGRPRRPDRHPEPEHVEISTNQLGVRLGIGRGGARTRLDNAIESGAVIDVGAGDLTRHRTAPKLLAPGRPVIPKTTGRWPRTGAFPSLPEVMAEIKREQVKK